MRTDFWLRSRINAYGADRSTRRPLSPTFGVTPVLFDLKLGSYGQGFVH